MKWNNVMKKNSEIRTVHTGSGESEPGETRYRCPMGCEGDKSYSHPGNCPVCNMKLMPV